MGMSTYVIGIKPPNEKWHKMKNAYEACEAAGVAVPDAVTAFFVGHSGDRPDPAGVQVDLPDLAVSEYRDDTREGIEVDLNKIDIDITKLRFVNSW